MMMWACLTVQKSKSHGRQCILLHKRIIPRFRIEILHTSLYKCIYMYSLCLEQPGLLLEFIPFPEGEPLKLRDGHAKDLVELFLGQVAL